MNLYLKNHRPPRSSVSGFTLVELLVVISIIALLSIMAVVALNSARQKSRDAARVSDMRQFSTAMETFQINYKTYKPSGCAAAGTALSACTGNGGSGLRDIMVNISNLNDPSVPVSTLCTASSTAVCNYSFTTLADANTYAVTFYLEGGTGLLAAGSHTLTPAGIQ